MLLKFLKSANNKVINDLENTTGAIASNNLLWILTIHATNENNKNIDIRTQLPTKTKPKK